MDKFSLQHSRYPNVFSLGDVAGTPNAKTGAAVRKQAPVLVENLLHYLEHQQSDAVYDGYSSCPIVTGYGKMLLAEFDYENKAAPSLPVNTSRATVGYVDTKEVYSSLVLLEQNAERKRLRDL